MGEAGYTHHVRIRYGEVDMQRVVFNAHYLAYCDDAADLWFRSIGALLEGGEWDVMDPYSFGPVLGPLDDLLIPLVLVLTGDEPSGPCRGAPVDLARRVVLPVVPELVELQSLTTPASLQDTNLRETIVGGEPRVMHDSSEVRVDANTRGLTDRLLVVPQPER